MFFFPSDARTRHLYSIASPVDANLFSWALDLSDAVNKTKKHIPIFRFKYKIASSTPKLKEKERVEGREDV